MKGVQCYELFGGIALKIHTFSFSFFIYTLKSRLTSDYLRTSHKSHKFLLSKLCYYGIRNHTLSWIGAFLSNRTQTQTHGAHA